MQRGKRPRMQEEVSRSRSADMLKGSMTVGILNRVNHGIEQIEIPQNALF